MEADEHGRQERRAQEMTAAFDSMLAQRLDEHMKKEDALHDEKRKWHFGKEFPIALVVAVALQTSGIIWWAASTSERVAFIKESELASQIVQTAVDRRQDNDAREAEKRVMVMFERVDRKLDRLIEVKQGK